MHLAGLPEGDVRAPCKDRLLKARSDLADDKGVATVIDSDCSNGEAPLFLGVRGASTFDAARMEERMDAIRLKQILGAPLTERELMCLQIEQNGMACHARPLRYIPLDPYPSHEDPFI